MFEIEMGATVRIKCSGEQGVVIGRCEHQNMTEHDYRVRYKAADGRACEAWWTHSAIETV